MSGAMSATSLATIGLGSSIGSMGAGLIGSMGAASSQKSSLQFQADIGRINAGIADTNASMTEALGESNAQAIETAGDFNSTIAELGAQSALSAGQQQIATQTIKAGQLKGKQRAALAANGIDLGEGSAAEVQASSDVMKEIDLNTLQQNVLRTAWGYRAQGMAGKLQSNLQALNTRSNAQVRAMNLRTGGANSQMDAMFRDASASGISPITAGATSLLGSAGSVASSWYRLSQASGAAASSDPLGDFGKAKGWWN